MAKVKKIAALTMLRNDFDFLAKWVEYYSQCFGINNLYVFLDGLDQPVPDYLEGANVIQIEHKSCPVAEGDKNRVALLSAKAAELFKEGYELVLGTDVDEFLAPDPKLGVGLAEFLSGVKTNLSCISGLGVDVAQNLYEEISLDWSQGLLEQRSYAQLCTRYSKATVLCKPVQWGSGFHRVRHGNFHITKDLYLFHFGSADLQRIKERMLAGSELIKEGWERHLNKRTKTIRLVSDANARDFDSKVGCARIIQNLFRPPYAWNKPSMFEAKVVVQLPERFKSIV